MSGRTMQPTANKFHQVARLLGSCLDFLSAPNGHDRMYAAGCQWVACSRWSLQ